MQGARTASPTLVLCSARQHTDPLSCRATHKQWTVLTAAAWSLHILSETALTQSIWVAQWQKPSIFSGQTLTVSIFPQESHSGVFHSSLIAGVKVEKYRCSPLRSAEIHEVSVDLYIIDSKYLLVHNKQLCTSTDLQTEGCSSFKMHVRKSWNTT